MMYTLIHTTPGKLALAYKGRKVSLEHAKEVFQAMANKLSLA